MNLYPIQVAIELSFMEAVQGCRKTINYETDAPCDACSTRHFFNLSSLLLFLHFELNIVSISQQCWNLLPVQLT